MNNEWTQERWEATLKQIYKRASTDDAFRKLCLQDGVTAIKQISGLELPSDAKVRFVEKLEEMVLALPRSGELSDRELDAVAGGGWKDIRDMNKNNNEKSQTSG